MTPNRKKYGLIAGVGTVFYFLLFYFVDPQLFLHPAVIWGSWVIYLACMMKATWEERDKMGGVLTFKEAIQPIFTVYLIANAIYYAFLYLQFNFIATNLIELQKEIMVAHGQTVENQDLQMTLSKTLITFCASLIGGFIISAVMAFILKREH